MNTKVYSLTLFVHPIYQKLTIIQVAKGRSLAIIVKIALDIAKHWKWDIMIVKKLSDDLQACNQSVAPFAGDQASSPS